MEGGADRGISIHAPREGGDTAPTTSKTETTISIHAPREGGDDQLIQPVHLHINFNPRPPRGGRLLSQLTPDAGRKFQSTPPARGATLHCRCAGGYHRISIHAPREGGD